MSKKISIYNATYGRIDEIDRSQIARDASFEKAQDYQDSRIPSSIDLDTEEVHSKASDLAMEQAEHDAKLQGYDNIDDYAMDKNIYGLVTKTTTDGEKYSPGEQLIDILRSNFEDMIMSGEI